MEPLHDYVRYETRRQFFRRGASFMGAAALGMLAPKILQGAEKPLRYCRTQDRYTEKSSLVISVCRFMICATLSRSGNERGWITALFELK